MMAKFVISVDLLIPVLLEVEAKDEEDALDVVYAMPHKELLRLANTEEACIGILNSSETVEAL